MCKVGIVSHSGHDDLLLVLSAGILDVFYLLKEVLWGVRNEWSLLYIEVHLDKYFNYQQDRSIMNKKYVNEAMIN